jgi:hypothetical protein
MDKDDEPARGPLYLRRLNSFRGETLEHKLQELIDREEIRDLISTYAHRMAHGAAVANLFTDDGAYVNRGIAGVEPREIRGRAALDAYYGDRKGAPQQPLPMIHNHLIEVEGDEANSICEMDLRLGVKGVTMIGAGYYQDRFRRVDGRWKFVLRDWTYFYWTPQQLD